MISVPSCESPANAQTVAATAGQVGAVNAASDPDSRGADGAQGNGRDVLLEHHRVELRASGLTDTTIGAAEIYSETDHARLAEILNWCSAPRKMVPAIVFPYFAPTGPAGYSRIKSDNPRRCRGEPVRYESPRDRPGQGAKSWDSSFPKADAKIEERVGWDSALSALPGGSAFCGSTRGPEGLDELAHDRHKENPAQPRDQIFADLVSEGSRKNRGARGPKISLLTTPDAGTGFCRSTRGPWSDKAVARGAGLAAASLPLETRQ